MSGGDVLVTALQAVDSVLRVDTRVKWHGGFGSTRASR